ncbi:MAG: choice-of-anchor Q domain-containing protein, partial [Cyanobacteria bacterium J06614_10]
MSILTVRTTADTGSGSLRHAIATAKSGDTIRFSKQLAGKTIRLKSGQLVLNKNLTIDGGQAPGLTVSGEDRSRVFYLDRKRKATIKSLTIANGKTTGAGGGIDTRHESEIVLQNVKLQNNTSELGGGMRVGHLAKATILDSSFTGNDGTLTEKYKGFSAGAIVHNESRGQLIVRNTTFENNKGFIGGAIYSFSSVSLVVEESTFLRNTATALEGGAIFTDGVSSKGYNSGLENEGKIIIRRSRFEGNRAKAAGGALYLWGYTKNRGYEDDRAIVEDSTFFDNVAEPNGKGKAKGGALWAKMGLDIRNVTFARNTAAQQGGAIWTETGLPINIANSTFSGNRALQDAGGAMFLNNRSTPVNITNSTIVYNEAGRANGALWFDGSHAVTLKNSILAFNTAQKDRRQDQVGYQPKDGGGNLEFASSSRAMRAFENAIVADPRLGVLTQVNGDWVHPLLAGSPAVNAGVSQGAPSTDQRGASRVGQVDIGSYEWRNVTSAQPSSPMEGPKFSVPKGKRLLAHLSFDEEKGRRVKDRSDGGKNNFGMLANGAKRVQGPSQGAISLDGENDVVKLRNSSDINLGKHSERTVSLWFKADRGSFGDRKQVIYEEGAQVRGLNIYLDAGKLYVGGWNRPQRESGWAGTWLSTDNVVADEWHRVDLVLEGGTQVRKGAIRG